MLGNLAVAQLRPVGTYGEGLPSYVLLRATALGRVFTRPPHEPLESRLWRSSGARGPVAIKPRGPLAWP